MALLKNTKVVQVDAHYGFIPIAIRRNRNLTARNVGESMNDKQIQNIRDYYFNRGHTIWSEHEN